MNLVYKEDVVLRQIGEQRGQIAGLLNGGAGGDADIDPHLVGNDAAEGGFTQAGRAVKQNVVQGLAPHFGGLDKDLQVALGLLLPDILPQGLGAQGTLVLVIPRQRCGDERLLGLKPGIGKVNAQTLTSSLNA